MPSDLFTEWLELITTTNQDVRVYKERINSRSIGLQALKKLLEDHFIGEETILRAGGYEKAAQIIANSLPTSKRTQSGDLGELLATEYVNSETTFVVPIKKLRWKSDRQMAMHGNDLIAIDTSTNPVRVMKGECKSRVDLGKAVIDEAAEALDRDEGRPNPSTLAFITKRLYEEKRDEEAKAFRDLQCDGAIGANNLIHMIFVLTGNNPAKHLTAAPKPKRAGIKRDGAGILIADHAAFVTEVYKAHGA